MTKLKFFDIYEPIDTSSPAITISKEEMRKVMAAVRKGRRLLAKKLKVRLDKTQAFLSIKMYLIDYMRFLAGKRCPYYLSPEKYQQVVEQYDFIEGAEVWIKRLEGIA